MTRQLAMLGMALALAAVQAQGLRWDFADGMDGWRVGRHIDNLRVENGVLKGRVSGHDPQLISPLFDLTPNYRHEFVCRVKLSRVAGRGQLFFSDTTEGPDKGFDAKRVRSFALADTADWQIVRVRPFWQGEKRILQIRFDLMHGNDCAGVDFELDWLAIEEAPEGDFSHERRWDFKDNRHGDWTLGEGGRLVSPYLAITGRPTSWALITVRSAAPAWAELSWLSPSHSGMPTIPFLVAGDDQAHTYSIAVGEHLQWSGEAMQLSVQVVPEHEAPYELLRVELSEKPHAQAEVLCQYFGPAEYPNRVGKRNRMLLRLENIGHAPVAGTLHFRVPDGAAQRLEKDGKALLSMACTLPADFSETYEFDLLSQTTGSVIVMAELQIGGELRQRWTAKAVEVTPLPALPAAGSYVPEPKPAQTDYLIGSYYYPGFGTNRQWREMALYAPQTKPVLGYYDEGNPECIDWQIKWATEHGVNFFLVDWYWEAGRNYNEHWLDGFVQARHKRYCKWALMWANHNRKGTHSREDWIAVTERWLEKYICTPEYLTLDGKPVVFIWSPRNIREDMGGSVPSAEMLALSDRLAREAGLPGIVFYAMNQGGQAQLAQEGYAGYTTYHCFGRAQESSRNRRFYAYKAVVDQSPANWERDAAECAAAGLKFLPVVDTGWDARPRHGLDTFVIYDRNVAEFTRLLQDMKTWLDRRGQKVFVLGPWNEWTEGSYIEPCSEFGFEMLRAIRTVFCTETGASDDLCPQDMGLGPYDFALNLGQLRQDNWDFRGSSELFGWSALMYLKDLRLTSAGLTMSSVGRDPALRSGELRLNARDYTALEVTMAIKPASGEKDYAAVFWGTRFMPINGEATVTRPLHTDEGMHRYRFELSQHPKWRGALRHLRFDPIQRGDSTITIESIKLVPAVKP
ncbi:MAG: glycoside hydrolase family 99-like domain-containing protein [Lentisphaeria bacterium]|jgi:hypothetical protein